MSTLFVSDVHLSTERPEVVSHFLEFLNGPARSAEAVYILGDLFDEWLGDDDDRAPHPLVTEGVSNLVASGVPVCIMRGNHDFLLGAGFESVSGCSLMDDEEVVDLYGTRTLLMHGDSLCTRDTEYQAFRKMSRDPENQMQFLALPFEQRAARAAEIRGQSKASMRLKTDEIMDVTPSAVSDIMHKYGVRHFVHGHTHRPAVHDIRIDGAPGKRVVLGDWYEQDSVLSVSENGFALGRLSDIPG